MNDEQIEQENEAIDIVKRYNDFTDKSENRLILKDLRRFDNAVLNLDDVIHSLAYNGLSGKVLEEFIRTKLEGRYRDTGKDVLYKFCDYYCTLKKRSWEDYRERLAKDKAKLEEKENAES